MSMAWMYAAGGRVGSEDEAEPEELDTRREEDAASPGLEGHGARGERGRQDRRRESGEGNG